MPIARLFGSAKREVHFRADGGSIYIENPRVHVAHRAEGAVDVLRIDRRRESIDDTVPYFDSAIEIIARDDGNNGAEDLLLSNPHPGIDIRKNRWFVKESSGVLSVREPASAADQPCSFVESYADILLYGAELVFVNAGAHIHGSIQAVSYPQGPGPASESVQRSEERRVGKECGSRWRTAH